MLFPNIAIIRISDTQFNQYRWLLETEEVECEEFTLEDPEDSYFELDYNQMMFASFNAETSESEAIQSYTLSNESGMQLKDADFADIIVLIKHILKEEFHIKI